MRIMSIATRRRHLAALLLEPLPEPVEGAAYEGERLLIDRTILARCHISEGGELAQDELRDLVEVSECFRAKQRAVWYLSQGDCTRKKLIEKLTRAFSRRAADFAADQMERKGYLSDERFATRFIEQLRQRNISKRDARVKLLQKGVPAALADRLLCGFEEDEADRLKRLVQTKYKNKIGTEEDRRRTVQALQRRGYSFSDIRAALALEQLADESSEEI